jgi:hypothetical protein
MKISGKIVDFSKEPLSGANIVLITGPKANKIGTYTNFDGLFNFESKEFSEKDVFRISFIGYKSKDFLAKNLQNTNITLSDDITVLNDVVLNAPKKNTTNATNNEVVPPKVNKIKDYFQKNKYTYAGAGGLLGLALMLVSIKKLK